MRQASFTLVSRRHSWEQLNALSLSVIRVISLVPPEPNDDLAADGGPHTPRLQQYA